MVRRECTVQWAARVRGGELHAGDMQGVGRIWAAWGELCGVSNTKRRVHAYFYSLFGLICNRSYFFDLE